MESSCLFSNQMLVLCLLLIFGLFPKVGEMKRVYQRVENGGPTLQMIAAVMSGVAAGTGVSNIAIIKTTIPYAIGIIILTAIGFIICGISATGL